MPLFKKIEFYSFCACTLNLGGLEMRFPNVQSMGAFFWVIYILNRTSGPIFSLLPFFSHKLSNSTILCMNSWQARNTHHSGHWSAPLFMFLLPAENSCMRMRNKIKTNCDNHLYMYT